MDKLSKEQDFHNHAFSNNVRAETNRFYSIFYLIQNQYLKTLTQNSQGKKYLEYGCGEGSSAYEIARNGGVVYGIDISNFAIEQARIKAAKQNLGITFKQMNAEDIKFEPDFFDLVCGSGILHHLDVEKAYAEISKVLKPGGKAIFMEPLGRNFLINWYRNRTPQLRTEDEHPLLKTDIKKLDQFFGDKKTSFYFFTALAAIPLRNSRIFKPVLHFLNRIDKFIFTLLPFMRWHAWFVLIEMSKPKEC
ncbi:MAG: class I SAM-dependent methyltransferase [Bacteroidales bacterium]